MIKDIRYYKTRNGKCPFLVWQDKLKDVMTQARIDKRLREVAKGYYGDYKLLGDGLMELRLSFGKGYRIYCAEYEQGIIVILHGGTKNTKKEQSQDIAKVRKYWQDFLNRGEKYEKNENRTPEGSGYFPKV